MRVRDVCSRIHSGGPSCINQGLSNGIFFQADRIWLDCPFKGPTDENSKVKIIHPPPCIQNNPFPVSVKKNRSVYDQTIGKKLTLVGSASPIFFKLIDIFRPVSQLDV
jgi:hypothetical protein